MIEDKHIVVPITGWEWKSTCLIGKRLAGGLEHSTEACICVVGAWFAVLEKLDRVVHLGAVVRVAFCCGWV